MNHRFVLGVDLGQAHDFTALVVIERAGDELHVRHIERLPLATPYPAQVDRIEEVVASPELGRDVLVAVDGTGVGRAVVDLLRTALKPHRTPLVAITITGGTAASRMGSRWSIPKRDLIASAQVALQSKTLKIAAGLPTAQVLVDELTAYRVKVSDDGHDSYGNGRDAPNDDLVLATAIASYAATKKMGARMTNVTVHQHPLANPDPVLAPPDVVVVDRRG